MSRRTRRNTAAELAIRAREQRVMYAHAAGMSTTEIAMREGYADAAGVRAVVRRVLERAKSGPGVEYRVIVLDRFHEMRALLVGAMDEARGKGAAWLPYADRIVQLDLHIAKLAGADRHEDVAARQGLLESEVRRIAVETGVDFAIAYAEARKMGILAPVGAVSAVTVE